MRIEHTLFSLPFAYAGLLLVEPRPPTIVLVLVGLAVLGLRTAAMAYNNIADLDIDSLNPRSRSRPLVTGAVSMVEAYALVVLGSLLYYASALAIHKMAAALSPILWSLAMTYPYAKRVHSFPHLHLGLVLGLVVFGGAVAGLGLHYNDVVEVLARVPWLLVAATSLWVAGFDTIYSIMDYEFDRAHGLGSLPARLGVEGALWAARLMHGATITLLVAQAALLGYRPAAVLAAALASLLLVAQHLLLARRGLSAVPEAFNMNLAVGLIIGLGFALAPIV